MWINENNNNEVIKEAKGFRDVNGVLYPSVVFTRWTEEELNAVGIFKLVKEGHPNRRYVSAVENPMVKEGNVYYIRYTTTELPLDEVKNKLKKTISDTFRSKASRPRVTTSLGFDVDGSRDDILNFEDGKAFGLTYIKDANGVTQIITVDQWDTIISEVKQNGLELYQTKWTKEAEVDALATVADCILYEATPYTYTYTAEDAANDINGTIVEGDTTTRYTNNCKDW